MDSKSFDLSMFSLCQVLIQMFLVVVLKLIRNKLRPTRIWDKSSVSISDVLVHYRKGLQPKMSSVVTIQRKWIIQEKLSNRTAILWLLENKQINIKKNIAVNTLEHLCRNFNWKWFSTEIYLAVKFKNLEIAFFTDLYCYKTSVFTAVAVQWCSWEVSLTTK